MNRFIRATALFPLLAATQTLQAADADTGKSLLESNCTSCHGDAVYTRENRRVTTLDGLNAQVMRCDQSLGLKWFDDDIDAVTSYLNKTYYHFK
ncbi:MAG: cytochrome c [Gammaproteobacteria bacterium]|nr:cytochrome c [Gammaproteobacteria bacterium]